MEDLLSFFAMIDWPFVVTITLGGYVLGVQNFPLLPKPAHNFLIFSAIVAIGWITTLAMSSDTGAVPKDQYAKLLISYLVANTCYSHLIKYLLEALEKLPFTRKKTGPSDTTGVPPNDIK